jgi:6-phosphogluconolactonase
MSLRLACWLLICSCSTLLSAAEHTVYFGTYTGEQSRGIYRSQFDDQTGKLTEPKLAAEITNPTFLALHPTHPVLYAVAEVADFKVKGQGGLVAFTREPNGQLQKLNEASTRGPGPCHVSVNQAGNMVLATNYSGGSVIAYQLQADGKLGNEAAFFQHTGSSVNPQRQKEPHAHCIRLSPNQRWAIAADLGIDQILIYDLDAKNTTLKQHGTAKLAPGSGPRHIAFAPSGKYLYVLNELLCTLTVFAWDEATGQAQELQTTTTLPVELGKGMSTAEIVVHPSGKFLYASNRGHNTIAVFSIAADGRVTLQQNQDTQGKTPRNFNLDPTGRWLLAANQDSSTVHVFTIDQTSGKLTLTPESIKVGKPVCVLFAK